MNMTVSLHDKDEMSATVLGPGASVGRFIALRVGQLTIYLRGEGLDAATAAEQLGELLTDIAAEVRMAEHADLERAIAENEREPDPDTAFESRRLTIQGGR